MQRHNVGLAKKCLLIHRCRFKTQVGFHIQQIVIDHPHAKTVRGNFSHPPAHPAHAQNAYRQFVQLHATLGVADTLELLGLVGAILEKSPRPEQLQRITNHKITHRQSVRIRRVHNLHAAGPAGLHINVLNAHPTPTNHLQLRGSRKQGSIHLGVGAHYHALHFWQGSIELGGIGSGLDHNGPLLQPG